MHTCGPWEPFDAEIVARDTDVHIAEVPLCDGTNPTEWQANLRLIAAAPDLLTSCKELRDGLAAAMRVIYANGLTEVFIAEIARAGIQNGIGKRAEAAIAKAESA